MSPSTLRSAPIAPDADGTELPQETDIRTVAEMRRAIGRAATPLIRRPYNRTQNHTYRYNHDRDEEGDGLGDDWGVYAIEQGEDGMSTVYMVEEISRTGKWHAYETICEETDPAIIAAVLSQREEDMQIKDEREKYAAELAQGDKAFEYVLRQHLDSTDGMVEEPYFLNVEIDGERIQDVPFFRLYTEVAYDHYLGVHNGRIFDAELNENPRDDYDYEAIVSAMQRFCVDAASETEEAATLRLHAVVRSLMLKHRRVTPRAIAIFFHSESRFGGLPEEIMGMFDDKTGRTIGADFRDFKKRWLEETRIPVGYDRECESDWSAMPAVQHALHMQDLTSCEFELSFREIPQAVWDQKE